MDKYKIPNVKTFEYTKIIGLENIEFGTNIIIDDFVLIYAKDKISKHYFHTDYGFYYGVRNDML